MTHPREQAAIVALESLWQWESICDLLEESFPPSERDSRAALIAGFASGAMRAYGVVTDHKVVATVAVVTAGEVELLLYLAVSSTARAGGLGGRLVDFAIADATARGIAWVLGEVEHPGHHHGSAATGDPKRRVAFYASHGVRFVDVPYFMPALTAGGPRVPALMLGIFAVADRYVAERDPSGRVTAVLASPLRDFVIAYLTASEGRLGTDAATARLLGALDAATVRVLGAEEIDHISVSVLTGDATHAPTGAPGTAATPAASTP